MPVVGVAAAAELDQALNGHDAAAAVDGQGGLVQRVEPELAADLVVADDQVLAKTSLESSTTAFSSVKSSHLSLSFPSRLGLPHRTSSSLSSLAHPLASLLLLLSLPHPLPSKARREEEGQGGNEEKGENSCRKRNTIAFGSARAHPDSCPDHYQVRSKLHPRHIGTRLADDDANRDD